MLFFSDFILVSDFSILILLQQFLFQTNFRALFFVISSSLTAKSFFSLEITIFQKDKRQTEDIIFDNILKQKNQIQNQTQGMLTYRSPEWQNLTKSDVEPKKREKIGESGDQ